MLGVPTELPEGVEDALREVGRNHQLLLITAFVPAVTDGRFGAYT
jgi:hypothetical protein